MNGFMVGYLEGFIVLGVNEANNEYIASSNWCLVIPETLGQYTGLKDKNGKEIYEGDILLQKNCKVWEEYTKARRL